MAGKGKTFVHRLIYLVHLWSAIAIYMSDEIFPEDIVQNGEVQKWHAESSGEVPNR